MNGRFLIVLIVLILAVALLPRWPYTQNWGVGYYPSGGLGLVLLILVVLLLLGLL